MRRTTIKDIAAEVGVSHTTVCYVLNGNTNQKISAKTREAVMAAARKLNYVPNEAARSLRRDSTQCVAVALEKSITMSRFNGILQGIREELSAEGYGLLLMDFHTKENQKNPHYVESVLQKRADGIIYISSDGSCPSCSKRIEKYGLPFVGCDCCPSEKSLGSVSFDYERGAFEIACRLFGEGAKNILYWQPDSNTAQEHYREKGLRSALALYPGTTLKICKMAYDSRHSMMDGRSAYTDNLCRQSLVQTILPQMPSLKPGDAIICSWGVMVKHLCAALYRNTTHNIKIALLSDSDAPMIPDMKILTSRPGFVRGGQECARLLLSMIRGEEPEHQIIVPPEPPTYISF